MKRVLIPKEMEGFLSLPEGVGAVCYRHRYPSIFERIKNKLLRPKADVFRYKVILEENAPLSDVVAFWMSSGTELSSEETRQLLEHLSALQWVYSQRTGLDHLHLEHFANRGVRVSNTGDLVSAWVAQVNLACILSHAKKIPTLLRKQRAFERSISFCDDVEDLHVGILGTGNIGNETARLCSALGMNVTGISKRPQEVLQDKGYHSVLGVEEFESLLPDLDYLVLTLPLHKQSKHLITSAVLEKLKSTACLINLSRPGIVDGKALIAHLRSKKEAAAYVSNVSNLSRFQRIRSHWMPNLVLTNFSEANLKKKTHRACHQFLTGLKDWEEKREVENCVL